MAGTQESLARARAPLLFRSPIEIFAKQNCSGARRSGKFVESLVEFYVIQRLAEVHKNSVSHFVAQFVAYFESVGLHRAKLLPYVSYGDTYIQ